MRRNPRFRGFIVSMVLALCAGVAGAQVDVGTLGGQVKDETGAALPGAGVTATSIERGFSRSTVTDTTGRFLFSQTAPGRYKVTVSLSGFATVTVTDNLVENQRKTEIAVTMKLSAQQAEVTVTGEVPIVDKTNGALESRQRAKEFEKMPVGRNYQTLFGNAPGVNGTGNANVHGALSGNNLFMYDGVDTTDPTTGTFGSNLNFEAIQEVVVQTSAVSAEYGRATGGIINVITKSGTNTFAGSFKTVMTNDNWNAQNKTVNTNQSAACTPNCSTSLARVKFPHLNLNYAATLGGPLWPDHIWFFGGYEPSSITGARQTTPISGENFQQTTKSKFWDAKLTAQITPSVQFSARGSSAPTSGFVVNYVGYGAPGELVAYTGQDQTSKTYAGFLTGVFGSNLTAEGQYNWNGPSNTSTSHYIDVYAFPGAGSLHYSLANGFQFNGPAFEGFVNRPRQGALGAVTYFAELGGNSHSFKAGVDYQHLSSAAQFGFVNNQAFIDESFDYVTRTFVPSSRQDYDVPVASISDGKIIALYARDKFEIGKTVFMEVGLRYEHQSSKDDIRRATVSAGTVSPRVSLSYDIFSTGKSLVVGTYGRFYQFVIQNFSDGFAQNAQEASYNNYNWNGTQYVFSNRVVGSGTATQPNSNIKPTFVDEGTLGFRQQIGNTVGVTLTGIYRHWGNLIEDIPILDGAGNQTTTYVNYGKAVRKFWGAELVLDKRFSEHWNANASYSWGKTTFNTSTASDFASSLGDYLTSNCRNTTDLTIGTNGVIPCSIVVEGPNKTGLPSYNLTSNIKAGGAYVQSVGPVNLAVGLGGQLVTGVHFQKQRTMNVLIPGTTTNAGPTETYYYDARGTETAPTTYSINGSLETTFTVFRTLELGVKGEVFNITDQQKQITVNQTTWCDNAAASPTSSCGLARTNFGKATARGSFQAPRSYRLTALLRF